MDRMRTSSSGLAVLVPLPFLAGWLFLAGCSRCPECPSRPSTAGPPSESTGGSEPCTGSTMEEVEVTETPTACQPDGRYDLSVILTETTCPEGVGRYLPTGVVTVVQEAGTTTVTEPATGFAWSAAMDDGCRFRVEGVDLPLWNGVTTDLDFRFNAGGLWGTMITRGADRCTARSEVAGIRSAEPSDEGGDSSSTRPSAP